MKIIIITYSQIKLHVGLICWWINIIATYGFYPVVTQK